MASGITACRPRRRSVVHTRPRMTALTTHTRAHARTRKGSSATKDFVKRNPPNREMDNRRLLFLEKCFLSAVFLDPLDYLLTESQDSVSGSQRYPFLKAGGNPA